MCTGIVEKNEGVRARLVGRKSGGLKIIFNCLDQRCSERKCRTQVKYVKATKSQFTKSSNMTAEIIPDAAVDSISQLNSSGNRVAGD
jgi:hypothetical protein